MMLQLNWTSHVYRCSSCRYGSTAGSCAGASQRKGSRASSVTTQGDTCVAYKHQAHKMQHISAYILLNCTVSCSCVHTYGLPCQQSEHDLKHMWPDDHFALMYSIQHVRSMLPDAVVAPV